MSNANNGVAVTGTISRYLPFGDWRTEPTAGLTDEGYTGHKHNNLGGGADDLGLIYMNARYYVPNIGRFASADTIVPDPANPQSFNRYSYVNNNPLRYIDPTGHFTNEAIWNYIMENECDGNSQCAEDVWWTWYEDEEWWGMLQEAEAGDQLFGQYCDGNYCTHSGTMTFTGEKDSKLTGLSGSNGRSDSLSKIQAGSTLWSEGELNFYFQWGGLFAIQNGHVVNVIIRMSVAHVSVPTEGNPVVDAGVSIAKGRVRKGLCGLVTGGIGLIGCDAALRVGESFMPGRPSYGLYVTAAGHTFHYDFQHNSLQEKADSKIISYYGWGYRVRPTWRIHYFWAR